MWKAQQQASSGKDGLDDGIVTKNLVNLMEGITPKTVNSAQFIAAIRERLERRIA